MINSAHLQSDGNARGILPKNRKTARNPPTSDADVKVTRDLVRAGQPMKLNVLDNAILGLATAERSKDYSSLRELGYF